MLGLIETKVNGTNRSASAMQADIADYEEYAPVDGYLRQGGWHEHRRELRLETSTANEVGT